MTTESPLKGWPPTSPLNDGAGFRVRARHMTPQRAKVTDTIGGLFNLAALGLAGWLFFGQKITEGRELLMVVGVIIGVCAVVWWTRRLWGLLFLGKTTIVEFAPDAIGIKRMMRFRTYDRKLPHEFEFTIHDEAEREHEDAEEQRVKADREGKKELPKPEKYFRDSFHIILRYAGQRIDVADVFGKKQAEALLVRLQLLDKLMDAARGDATTPVFAEPDMQYGERPEAG